MFRMSTDRALPTRSKRGSIKIGVVIAANILDRGTALWLSDPIWYHDVVRSDRGEVGIWNIWSWAHS